MAKKGVIGIDLGTTNSCVSAIENGEAVVIPNAEGARTTPSVVAFSKDGGERLIGITAKRQSVTNFDRTIASVKRHMGEDWKVEMEIKRMEKEKARLGKMVEIEEKNAEAKTAAISDTFATFDKEEAARKALFEANKEKQREAAKAKKGGNQKAAKAPAAQKEKKQDAKAQPKKEAEKAQPQGQL